MLLRGQSTTLPDDLPVPDGTQAEIRRLVDDSFVANVTTVGGWFTYSQNGSPGPFKIVWDYPGTIKTQYSKITGPSGAVDVGNLPIMFRAFSNGVIDNVSGEIAIS